MEEALKITTDVKAIAILKGEPNWCVVMNKIIITMLGILLDVHRVPIELIMPRYSTLKRSADDWFSKPFYTGPRGYKMCIRVNANGDMICAGIRVSVFVHLMRGEYDSRLVWPFRGDITIQLVNHNNDQGHRQRTVDFMDVHASNDASQRVTSGDRNKNGWGHTDFIFHSEVESSTETSRYIIDDCLTFRVTDIVVRSVKGSV